MDRTKQNRTINPLSHRTVGGALVVAAALVANGLPAHAQQTEVEALRAQIEELSNRLEKIEADQLKTADAAKAAPPTSAKFPLTISGLGQVHYLGFYNQENSLNINQRAVDTFRLRRAELRIAAPTITSRISGSILLDPAKAAATSGATPATGGLIQGAGGLNQANNILQELQISYLLRKAPTGSSNNAYIDLGQYKIPVGYESLVSSSALQTVERALQFSQRDPFGGGYGDVRDTGAQLRGTQGQFDYRLGVFNGLGERQNALALSDAKAVLGLLSYKVKSIDGLQLGVSGGVGNNRLTSGPLTGANSILNNRTRRSLFNGFVVYKKDKLTTQAEYLTGDSQLQNINDPQLPASLFGFRQRRISSYYGSIGYLFQPKIEGVLRYDSFDFDRNLADTTVKDLTLGVNYYIKSNNAKIQFNIVHRNGGAGLIGANNFPGGTTNNFSNDRTELRTNFQIAF